MTVNPVETDAALEEFYSDLSAVDLAPLWTITEQLLTPTPRPRAVPWLWSAATMKPLARRAIQLVPVERGGERRVLSLQNPGLSGLPYAAGTLWGALQCLGPREVAPAHRHSPGAIRFVLEGEGVFTTVNGDACDMHPGDLVLTPSMNWHDHVNAGDGEMFWFDGLDLPMVSALDSIFFESYPGPGESQPEPAEHNVSERVHAGGVRYTDGAVSDVLSPQHSKLMIYRWADTVAELDRLTAASEDPLLSVEYTDPESGASVMPTMSCAAYRVRARAHSLPVRRTGNSVHVVFSGHGSSVIDGRRFDWGPGDMFVVPSWSAVEHFVDTEHFAEGTEEHAEVFVVSDAPVLRALGLYREQTLTAPQPVTDLFSPR
ncbi:cupin domain-containing protein [Pseudonocardia xinjiangensis]|uniref:Cupin domain-containing protein n=1 Tax=Pseudonocardia xinjiangensis TaxID=75289 RepID=A0ABX1REX4_9PSEU|nr:cupin domain-containing protein [Pseudonocardia xinjiangensis]NMH78336.1 cupin domain-containing protein [Pseudonocardia xinjiangensis]